MARGFPRPGSIRISAAKSSGNLLELKKQIKYAWKAYEDAVTERFGFPKKGTIKERGMLESALASKDEEALKIYLESLIKIADWYRHLPDSLPIQGPGQQS